MSTERRRVVVTGLGATTALGGDAPATWSALLAGKSGVRLLTEDWAQDLPVRIAATVTVDPSSVLSRVQLRNLDRCEQLALIAAGQAWRDAGAPQVDPDRLGVSVATAWGGIGSSLGSDRIRQDRGWRRVSPYSLPMIMANGPAAWIGLEYGAQAGVHATVSACASGTEAIGYGIEMIRSGRADVVLAGGTDASILPLGLSAFSIIRALSPGHEGPERACRPFDRDRDGTVLGEGAGILVLESAEHAARRGAVTLAEAVGVGYSSDAHHIAEPDPTGAGSAKSMQRALADAGVAPDRVVHVNAHATGTRVGDLGEALAIRRALGESTPGAVVSGIKSMTGHMIGGAGGVESVATVYALRERVAPPTINLEELDEEIAATGIDIATEPRELRVEPGRSVALNNSFGFGGHNVTLAFAAV